MSEPILLPVATARRAWQVLAQRCRSQRLLLTALAGLLVSATVAGTAVPLLIGVLVDDLIAGTTNGRVHMIAVAVLVAVLGSSLMHGAGLAVTGVVSERLLAALREDVVDVAMRLPVPFVEGGGSGDFVSRVSGDIGAIGEAARSTLPTLGRGACTVALGALGLLYIEPLLALTALVSVPFQARGLRTFRRRSAPVFAEERRTIGRRTQEILDAVLGAPTVLAYGARDRHRDRVGIASDAANRLALRAARVRTNLIVHLGAGELAGLGALLVVGFLLVDADGATVGEVTAAALLWMRLFDPISELLELAHGAQAAGAALARLVGVTDAGIDQETYPVAVRTTDGGIALRQVNHAYVAGHPVLTDITMDVPPGRTTAIVGTSGAGKTTIARILAGTLRPTNGQVFVPDRGRIALVAQNAHVFRGSVAADLRLAAPDADDEELLHALETVGAAEWAAGLPEGLATVVGDGAHQLDATQVGQLALARLLLADPVVAVLDEATAEAGSAGARKLEAAVSPVLAGRTAIVIAHRLSQAHHADEIVVLDAGRIIERGSHEKLIAADGQYARLWDAWASRRPQE